MSRFIPTVVVTAGLVLFGGISRASAAETPTAPIQHQHQVMCENLDAHLAARLAFAEVKLGVTEAQKPAWKKLVESLKAAGEPVRKDCAANAAMSAEPVDLPARLKRVEGRAEAHAAALKIAVPAIEQFYAALSPEQKKIADEVLSHHHHQGMMHHQGMQQGAWQSRH